MEVKAGSNQSLLGRAKADAIARNAEHAKAKADATVAKGLRSVLREAGIGRAEVVVGRADVCVALTRSQVERLLRRR